MFIQVYFHKTRRYLDKLLVENISKILPSSKYPDDLCEYLKWDDLTVLDKIRESRSTSPIAEQFLSRLVMSCVYETSAHSNKGSDSKLCNLIKKELRKQLDCDIFEDTPNKMPHKIPTLEEYDASSGKGIPVLVRYMDTPSNVAYESLLLQSLIKPINIKRLYVEKKYVKKAKEIVSDLLKGDDN
jgi:HD superfamily phosphohydrolase